MHHRRRWPGPGRLRGKRRGWRDRRGHQPGQASRLSRAVGEARGWPHGSITQAQDGPGPRARARGQEGTADGWVVSDEPTDVKTVAAEGWRVDIAETCLDEPAPGCPLESSRIRSAKARERLCLGRALTTRSRVSQGTAVVTQGQRRWVDPPGCRGLSDLNLGWHGVHLALRRGYELVTRWHGAPEAEPEPAMASTRQAPQQPRVCLALEFHDAVA